MVRINPNAKETMQLHGGSWEVNLETAAQSEAINILTHDYL